ncbi:hypothetical protein D5086_023566 [Populus alba]|uniref:Uncharacterized protein n=1 Tax=Populus alba TaxID=43335 RepID=A0ACC4BA55_POPAL
MICSCRKTRPCPSTNPGCVSTNPQSSSFAFPWRIPGNVIQKLQEAMQKNAKIRVIEDAPNGNRHHTNATIVCINFFGLSSQYLQAEVDGGFDRDVLEFFVEGDVVANRSMDTKVTYVYPFTTALGDSQGQEERVKKILDELGWSGSIFYFDARLSSTGSPLEAKASLSLDVSSLIRKLDVSSYLQGGSIVTVTKP